MKVLLDNQVAGYNCLTPVLVHELLLLYYQFMMYESLNKFHAQYAGTLCSPPLIVMDFYQQVGRWSSSKISVSTN